MGMLFNAIKRYADALDFAMPSAKEFDRVASMLLKWGYERDQIILKPIAKP